jgi:hypothetical protein
LLQECISRKAQKCGGIKQIDGISTLPLFITGSPVAMHDINKEYKTCTDSLALKKNTYYHKYD